MLRLIWTDAALSQLRKLADRAPAQAAAVHEAMKRMAARDFGHLGRLTRGRRRRYRPTASTTSTATAS